MFFIEFSICLPNGNRYFETEGLFHRDLIKNFRRNSNTSPIFSELEIIKEIQKQQVGIKIEDDMELIQYKIGHINSRAQSVKKEEQERIERNYIVINENDPYISRSVKIGGILYVGGANLNWENWGKRQFPAPFGIETRQEGFINYLPKIRGKDNETISVYEEIKKQLRGRGAIIV